MPLNPLSLEESTMELHEIYKQKMDANMREWSAQIALLEAKMKSASDELRVKRDAEIQELRAKQLAAAKKLHDLEDSSGEAWDLLKDTADKMWADLKAGVTEAQAKFK
jgi:hypothetical protein